MEIGREVQHTERRSTQTLAFPRVFVERDIQASMLPISSKTTSVEEPQISQILSRLRACYRTQDVRLEPWRLRSLVYPHHPNCP